MFFAGAEVRRVQVVPSSLLRNRASFVDTNTDGVLGTAVRSVIDPRNGGASKVHALPSFVERYRLRSPAAKIIRSFFVKWKMCSPAATPAVGVPQACPSSALTKTCLLYTSYAVLARRVVPESSKASSFRLVRPMLEAMSVFA